MLTTGKHEQYGLLATQERQRGVEENLQIKELDCSQLRSILAEITIARKIKHGTEYNKNSG